MNFTAYNDDYGKNELSNQLEKGFSRLSALQSLLVDDELGTEEAPIKEFKCVKDFLERPLNDSKENDLKKLFATAVVAAKEKGVLPFAMGSTPEIIASSVDEGLTHLKVGYKTEVGELDVIEAADALIDRMAVRTIAIADKVIERRVPVVTDKLCQALVKAYPHAQVVVPVIKHAEKYITVATKIMARKGVNLIAKSAKTVVRKAASKVVKVTSKIRNFLKA